MNSNIPNPTAAIRVHECVHRVGGDVVGSLLFTVLRLSNFSNFRVSVKNGNKKPFLATFWQIISYKLTYTESKK